MPDGADIDPAFATRANELGRQHAEIVRDLREAEKTAPELFRPTIHLMFQLVLSAAPGGAYDAGLDRAVTQHYQELYKTIVTSQKPVEFPSILDRANDYLLAYSEWMGGALTAELKKAGVDPNTKKAGHPLAVDGLTETAKPELRSKLGSPDAPSGDAPEPVKPKEANLPTGLSLRLTHVGIK